MTIRQLPPAPSRDRPNEFSLEMDAFLASMQGFADDANALEQSLQLVATTGTSSSTLTVGVGSKSLTTAPGKAWATGAWVYIFAAAAVSNYMVGRVTSYNSATGALVVNVSAIDGSGSHSSWIIGLATPAADGHLVARDGSRAMTAELLLSGDAVNALGAVPLQQLQALASSALSFSSLSLSATGTNASVSIAANELLLRGEDGSPRLVSGVNLTLNTAGSGVNGLDTGTLAASTWYAIWVINNGTTTAALLSLSAAAPTMPSGYTHKVRLGWTRTDGTASKFPLAFKQVGRSVEYQPASGANLTVYPQAASSTTTIGVTPVSLVNFVPPTAARLGARLRQDSVASTTNGIAIRPTASSEEVASVLGINGGQGVGTFWFALASLTVHYSVSTATGTGVLSVVGWEDNL